MFCGSQKPRYIFKKKNKVKKPEEDDLAKRSAIGADLEKHRTFMNRVDGT